MSKKLDNIDRNRQGSADVTFSDVPRSGYNLTYMNHDSLSLGRLTPTCYHHCMPADKISGSTESEFTFEQVSTPVMGTMQLAHHNFLVTLRSLNTEWEKFMTPTKLNGMNVSLTAPHFKIIVIYNQVLLWLDNIVKVVSGSGSFKVGINLSPSVTPAFEAIIPNSWRYHYCSDVLYDLREQLYADIYGSGIITSSTPTKDIVADVTAYNAFKQFFIDAIQFFAGKRSLLDKLGYQIFTADVLADTFDAVVNMYKNRTHSSFSDIFSDDDAVLSAVAGTIFKYDTDGAFKDMNEYALRAYYAIWFEYYRNYDLEPRSNNLSEYHSFGAASILGSFDDFHFLMIRPRSWSPDAFIKAGIDDISRHVFAPVLSAGSDREIGVDSVRDGQPNDSTMGNRQTLETLHWVNPETGVTSSVQVPVPSRLITQLQTSFNVSSFAGVELFSLKKAHMLENYLKRIFYGGDEYRDRMLSLYGARIEDYRINRPKWLSSSYDDVSPTQQVANSGALPGTQIGGVIQGQRVATAGVSSKSTDGYTEFVPENAIVIGLTSIMPRAQYDVLCPQNLQLKYTDYPIPQFANQMEDTINVSEVSRSAYNFGVFGYAPYGHGYRYRVDEVHGDYLDSRFDYTFSRFFNGLTGDATIPKLNWQFIHCRPKLPMFVDSILLDGQAYGKIKNNFLVERDLPTPVEVL